MVRGCRIRVQLPWSAPCHAHGAAMTVRERAVVSVPCTFHPLNLLFAAFEAPSRQLPRKQGPPPFNTLSVLMQRLPPPPPPLESTIRTPLHKAFTDLKEVSPPP